MKKVAIASLLAISTSFTGCASIISGSTQALSFKSVPDSANIMITNKKGEKIHTGITPATVSLKKGAGYFSGESYQVSFEKVGYQTKTVTITSTINGWYVANLIFGGLIGLLVVDPMTGAMYKLSPDDVTTTLEANSIETNKNEKSLTVMLVEDVPTEIMARAIQIPNK